MKEWAAKVEGCDESRVAGKGESRTLVCWWHRLQRMHRLVVARRVLLGARAASWDFFSGGHGLHEVLQARVARR